MGRIRGGFCRLQTYSFGPNLFSNLFYSYFEKNEIEVNSSQFLICSIRLYFSLFDFILIML